MKKFLIVLLRVILFLISLILCLPLLLLPKATLVPAYIWIPLILLDLALLVAYFAIKPFVKGTLLPFMGIVLVAVVAVVTSQLFAATPPILGEDGQPLPGSIATLERVELNGSRQWISIRGVDASKPVLLFLAGGPGGSQLATQRYALTELEQHFVVVHWEQPGSGKSFDAVKRSTLTPERYIEDGHALVAYLKERFNQPKVYVVGESWGSALGVMMAQRYPEDFYAFVGTGQMVSFLDTDQMCYDFALNRARENGDQEKVEKLLKLGPPPYYGPGTAVKTGTYLLDTFAAMNQNPAIYDNGSNTWRDLAAPEYGLYDKMAWFLGLVSTFDVVYPQLWQVDFRESADRLDVPVYFLIGRHDVNAPTSLTEEYYELLDAPYKEIVWFEHSGHNPWVSEADRFVEVMVEQVLPQSLP